MVGVITVKKAILSILLSCLLGVSTFSFAASDSPDKAYKKGFSNGLMCAIVLSSSVRCLLDSTHKDALLDSFTIGVLPIGVVSLVSSVVGKPDDKESESKVFAKRIGICLLSCLAVRGFRELVLWSFNKGSSSGAQ